MLAGVSLLLLPFSRGVDKAWNDLLSAGGILSTLKGHPNTWVRDQAAALVKRQGELEYRAQNFRVAFDQSDIMGNTGDLVREAPNLNTAIQDHRKRVLDLQGQAASGRVPIQQPAGITMPTMPSGADIGEWAKQNWQILALAGVAVVGIMYMRKD